MKRSLAIAALTAAILATTALGATPTYIELGIPVVKHLGGGAFWYERQRAELHFDDTTGVLFTHRQVGTAYPAAQGWATAEQAFAFFDKQLAARGWRVTGPGGNGYILPESRLLKPEQLRRYSRSGGSHPSAETVLAVWPIGGAIEGFHVALVTANPSLLYRLAKGLD